MNPRTEGPQTLTLGELLALEQGQREHLISPWLRQGESAMVFAAPGVGKSLLALSMALAVAGGGVLLDTWQTGGKPRKVLYIDGEMALDDIGERARILMPSAGGNLEAVTGNLQIMARQQQEAHSWFVDLSEERSQEFVISKAVDDGIELVILDNLSTLATIEDENLASAFNSTNMFLLKMKQAGIACLLVHHTAKASDNYRGSSKLATSFDVMIGLKGVNCLREGESCDTTRFILSFTKYRGKKDESVSRELEVSLERKEDKGGNELYKWRSETSTDPRLLAALELLRSEEYTTDKDIAAAVGMSRVEMSRMKKAAIERGMVSTEEWKGCIENAKGRMGKEVAGGETREMTDF